MRRKPRWLAGLAAISLVIGMSLLGGAPATAAEDRPDSLGKDFWVTFLRNYYENTELSLFISAPSPTSGEVTIPGLSWSQAFTTTEGAVTTVSIPAQAQLGTGADGLGQALGIHVTSADDVSLYGLNRIEATTDAFLGLPTDVLDTDHVVLAWTAPGVSGGLDSEFAVLATEDGTAVDYTPTADTRSGVAAGSTQTVTLDQGEALPVTSGVGDLSGTTVTSSAPVAVFGGHVCANVPDNNTFACDHIVEQIPGTSTWGQSFLTVPLKTRLRGDTFRMLASEDDTQVSINGTAVATLDRGRFHQQIIEGTSTISADKPILVAQYSNGSNWDGVTSDPFMMLVSPAEQFLSRYTFTTPASGFRSNFVNVVAPSAQVSDVTLDGTAVPASEFTPIPGTDFSAAQLDIGLGSHSMTSPKPFGIYVYGFDSYDSYGYPGGAAYAPINELTALTMTPPTQVATVGTQACVTTTALDQDGKGLPGIELTLEIAGLTTASTTGITDAKGEWTYCYGGAAVGMDTLTASFASQQLSASATIEWVDAVQPTQPPSDPPTTAPAPLPTPEPAVLPAKAQKLPINVKKPKGDAVTLADSGKVVLTKSITTNKHGKVAVRAFCTPVGSAASGEVRFCDVTVSKRGKVTVRSTGYDAMRVVVRAKATPKKGQSAKWLPTTWRKAWKITS